MRTKDVGTDTLMLMIKNLKDSGEITKEQYLKCKERNEQIRKEFRKDIIVDEV